MSWDDDVRSPFLLPKAIASSDDLREIFVNAYLFAGRDIGELRHLVPEPAYNANFAADLDKARAALVLKSAVEIATREKVEQFLRSGPLSTQLRRVAALLTAISTTLDVRTLARAGLRPFESAVAGRRFHVTPALEPIWRRAPKRPVPDEGDLEPFHPGVTVTPVDVSFGNLGQFRIEMAALDVKTRRRMIQAGQLEIAISGMTSDGLALRTDKIQAGQKTAFLVSAVENEVGQCEFLTRILDLCARAKVTMLVLPELRFTPAIGDELKRWFREAEDTGSLSLVVAGSWHVEEDGGYLNRSEVFEFTGRTARVLYWHDKLAPYTISQGERAKNPAFWESKGIGAWGARENIRRGETVTVSDTPFGRMTTAICKGFFDKKSADAMRKCGAHFFLVPAMTPKTDDLHTLAKELVRLEAGTFVANCAHIGKEERGFWRVPIDHPDSGDPAERESCRTQTAAANQVAGWRRRRSGSTRRGDGRAGGGRGGTRRPTNYWRTSMDGLAPRLRPACFRLVTLRRVCRTCRATSGSGHLVCIAKRVQVRSCAAAVGAALEAAPAARTAATTSPPDVTAAWGSEAPGLTLNLFTVYY